MLQWSEELGCIDIHFSAAIMAQYLVQPRSGHLDQLFHIFTYLKMHQHSRIILDDTQPQLDHMQFVQADWTSFYPVAAQPILPNAPEPRGKYILLSCFVNADHVGNKVTCQSHTDIIIFCNRAPIIWCSKGQNTVETSTFGSELISTCIAVELIESIH